MREVATGCETEYARLEREDIGGRSGICLNYVATEHRSSVKILAVLSIRDIYI